jgi:membrane protease YdiL (CAAX protease family)
MFSNKDLDADPNLEEVIAESQGRLQRHGDDGVKITSFKQVMLRHGLLMLLLALLCIFLPNASTDFAWSMQRFFSSPHYYALAFLALFVFLLGYSQLSDKVVNRKQLMWISYLLFISIVEEWIFRLVLPGFLKEYLTPIHAVVMSNLMFAGIHYFTLRWRLVWVIFAFFGAMGLSRAMSYGDLMALIWIHWLATFLNTPFPPGVKQLKESYKGN